MRLGGDETFAERTMRSGPSPLARAASVASRAETTMHSLRTSSELRRLSRAEFSSIIFVTRPGSREPPLTPIRIAAPLSRAMAQIAEKFSSRRPPRPTFPGLMRYLARVAAHSGFSLRSK